MNDFAEACSGSLASMASLALFYPLERVRSIAQVEAPASTYKLVRELYAREGVEGFYEGLKHTVVVIGASNFVYFYIFAFLKGLYLRKKQIKQIPSVMNLGFASIAGAANVLITTPLWVIATRAAVVRKKENRKSVKSRPIMKSLGDIVENEGIGALWAGTRTSLVLVSNPAIQFSSYEKLKTVLTRIRSLKESDLTSYHHLLLGAFSKMIATVITYPLQLSQTRIRSSNNKHLSTMDCLTDIYDKKGFKGWFSGMDAKLFQTCLTAAFMFAFYEKLSRAIKKVFQQLLIVAK